MTLLSSLPQSNAVVAVERSQTLQTDDSVQGVILDDKTQHQQQQESVVTIPLTNVRDTYYLVNISVNGHKVGVQLDTGSSDTWVVGNGYECLTKSRRPQDTEKCGLGRPFGGHVELVSPSKKFSRHFADGTFATGTLGEAKVSLGGGLTVAHQPIGIVDRTHWFGDGQASGMLGLGYPSLTAAGTKTGEEYDPVFTTLWKSNATAANFSLALSRLLSQKPSYLAFGGVPPGVIYDSYSWASTPLLPTTTNKDGTKQHGMYVIKPTAWVFSKRRAYDWIDNFEVTERNTPSEKMPTVAIDAGSTLSVLPTDMAKSMLECFEPPARWVKKKGAYYAPCDAKVPNLEVAIGERMNLYYFAKADILQQAERDASGKLCRVGITHPRKEVKNSGTTQYKLGINFLTNVVAVFDVGAGEMRLARRGGPVPHHS